VKSLLIRLFAENWQRKLISLILSMVIWMIVHQSMTVTKLVANIPVRVINVPPGKTIEGMQANGTLSRRLNLTLTGNKAVLDDLSEKDLTIEVDASGKNDEWVAVIDKKNLVSENPEIQIEKMISKVAPMTMIVRPAKLTTEKIPVQVTEPIGEAPKGYQFLDVWPYQLTLTVNGPEETVKKLKARGLKLTFNLNDISREELDALLTSKKKTQVDEVSFFVPNAWKKIVLSQLSDTPIEIDDPQAKALRIDFSRQDLLPLNASIPISLFYPQKSSHLLNPETLHLTQSDFISTKNGIHVINTPLYARGVSHLFLETVKDMIELVIVAAPKSERENLLWNVQFMYPQELEDRYVAKVMMASKEEAGEVQLSLREDYLRNRFRNYMKSFRLYAPNQKKLGLKIEVQGNGVSVAPN
jgi:hypothetical protein